MNPIRLVREIERVIIHIGFVQVENYFLPHRRHKRLRVGHPVEAVLASLRFDDDCP